MQKPADRLIGDLAEALDTHRVFTKNDRDLRDLHGVAEVALEMLTLIRQQQLIHDRDDAKYSGGR